MTPHYRMGQTDPRGIRVSTQAKEQGQTKTATIFVNTQPKEWSEHKISYDQVVFLEYGNNPPKGENVLITVTYRKGEDKKPEGSLTPGETTPVKDGMVFNVRATDRS